MQAIFWQDGRYFLELVQQKEDSLTSKSNEYTQLLENIVPDEGIEFQYRIQHSSIELQCIFQRYIYWHAIYYICKIVFWTHTVDKILIVEILNRRQKPPNVTSWNHSFGGLSKSSSTKATRQHWVLYAMQLITRSSTGSQRVHVIRFIQGRSSQGGSGGKCLHFRAGGIFFYFRGGFFLVWGDVCTV